MKRYMAALLAVLLISCFSWSPCHAGNKILARVTGTVASRKDADKSWKPLFTTREVENSDWARTRSSSLAKLFFEDRNSFVKVYENTEVQIKEVQEPGKGRKIELNQSIGRLRATVRKFLGEKQNVEIRTPTAVLAVEGTNADSLVLPDLTTIFGIYSGWGRAFAGGQFLFLAPGDSAIVYPGGSPVLLPHGTNMVSDASGNFYSYQDSASDNETGKDVDSEGLLDDTGSDGEDYSTPEKEASLGGEAPAETTSPSNTETAATTDAAPIEGTGTGSSNLPAPTVTAVASPVAKSTTLTISGTFGSSISTSNPYPAGLIANPGTVAQTFPSVGVGPLPPPAFSSGNFTNTQFDINSGFSFTLFDSFSAVVFSGTVSSGTVIGSGSWNTSGAANDIVDFSFFGGSINLTATGSPGQPVTADPAFSGSVSFDDPATSGFGTFNGNVGVTNLFKLMPAFKLTSVQSH